MTADKARSRPARNMEWTTHAPVSKRLAPEDIMSKPQSLSPEAEAAETEGNFWSLFFTQQVSAIIVLSYKPQVLFKKQTG